LEDKEAWLEDLKDAAKTVLDDAKKIAAVEGFEVKTLLLDGDAVHEIVKTVDDQHFDLIVMGAKGKSNLSKIFLGSVSSGVLKNASRPVLITKCLKKSNSKDKPT
jgi:nucleotide-binding universal stress UspA family protein